MFSSSMLPLLLLEAAAALPLPMVVLCAVCWRRWGGAKVRAGERGGGRWRPSSRSKAGGTDRRHHRLSMHRSIHHSGLACVCAMGAFCLLPGGAHSTAQPQPRAVERRTSPNLVSARKKARAREIEGRGEARQLPLLTPRLKSSAAKSLLAPQGPPTAPVSTNPSAHALSPYTANTKQQREHRMKLSFKVRRVAHASWPISLACAPSRPGSGGAQTAFAQAARACVSEPESLV